MARPFSPPEKKRKLRSLRLSDQEWQAFLNAAELAHPGRPPAWVAREVLMGWMREQKETA